MADLLDSSVKKKTVQDGFTNAMDRVRHFYIDGLIVLIFSVSIALAISNSNHFSPRINNYALITVWLIVYLLYFTLFEFFFGFTIGKFFNKTRVISLDNSKPTFSQILIRSLARLIPFSVITILTPYKATIHDLLSKTRTVRIKRKYVVEVNDF